MLGLDTIVITSEDVGEDVGDCRYGIAFLMSDTRLDAETRRYLTKQAAIMYLRDEEEQVLRTEELEGKITTQRKYVMLGTIGGQRFDAEVEMEMGKARLRFIVCERMVQHPGTQQRQFVN